MPELPDITVYIEALDARVIGQTLESVRLASPFLLRTFDPPIESVFGKRVIGLKRLGKRIAIEFDGDLWIVLHLMIAGRLHWKSVAAKVPGKIGLAALDFSNGTLILTEAGSKRRASLHVIAGESNVLKHDPGGIDVMTATVDAFSTALTRANHTLKKAIPD